MGNRKKYSSGEFVEYLFDKPGIPIFATTAALYLLAQAALKGYLAVFGALPSWFDVPLPKLASVALPAIIFVALVTVFWFVLDAMARSRRALWKIAYAIWCIAVLVFAILVSAVRYLVHNPSNGEFVVAGVLAAVWLATPLIMYKLSANEQDSDWVLSSGKSRTVSGWLLLFLIVMMQAVWVAKNAGLIQGYIRLQQVERFDNLAKGDLLPTRLVFTDGTLAIRSEWVDNGRVLVLRSRDEISGASLMPDAAAFRQASSIALDRYKMEMKESEARWEALLDTYRSEANIPKDEADAEIQRIRDIGRRMSEDYPYKD